MNPVQRSHSARLQGSVSNLRVVLQIQVCRRRAVSHVPVFNSCYGTHYASDTRNLGRLRLSSILAFPQTALVSRIRQAHEVPVLGNAIGRWDRSIAYNRLDTLATSGSHSRDLYSWRLPSCSPCHHSEMDVRYTLDATCLALYDALVPRDLNFALPICGCIYTTPVLLRLAPLHDGFVWPRVSDS